MATSSALFAKITMCSDAIRYRQPGDGGHKSSYDEVLKFLPPDKVTSRVNANLMKASLEYLKRGFRSECDKKAQIALYVASIIAEGKHEAGIAKEVCRRFRTINDFDRYAIQEVFNFSLCNDRLRKLLDNCMILRTKKIQAAIKREFNVEFVLLYFNVMESFVRRGCALADLGYTANVTPKDMERARGIVEQHVDDIAIKCSPCFKREVLKPRRQHNNMFPANDALPRVSIGCEHVKYDEATIETLKDSLMEKKEKDEFLGIMFSAISHAANDPVCTWRGIKLNSVKEFFLETMLDKAQLQDLLDSEFEMAESSRLQAVVASLRKDLLEKDKKMKILITEHAGSRQEEKIAFLKKKLSDKTDEVCFLRQKLGRKRKFCDKHHVPKSWRLVQSYAAPGEK